MLKRDITYENPFTEKQVTETHFFHISKADLVEMELEEHNQTYTTGEGVELTGMQAKLQKIVDTEDGKAIMAEFKDIIRRSYGIKDGERFRKTKEDWDNFASTEAFSQLLFELCTEAESAAEFINGVIPNNLDQIADEVRAQAELRGKGIEAQAAAKAAGTASAEAAAPEPAAETPEVATPTVNRADEIASATAENPVTLTSDEISTIDSDVFRSGIADGRYKLA